MKVKRYLKNKKITKMFKIKGHNKATLLAQNFVKSMTDLFKNQNETREYIDKENEIYMTEILNDDGSSYNIAFSTQLDYNSDSDVIKKVVKPYLDHKQKFFWYTISDWYEQRETIFFESLGFIKSDTLIGMINNIKKLKKKRKKKENNIKFRVVNDNARIKEFTNILKHTVTSNNADYGFYKSLLKINRQKDFCKLFLLYKDDIPAATGTLYFEDNMVIIDDIATNPQFQQQGLAKKMIEYLLYQAKLNHYNFAGLIATSEGFTLYKKLGFRPISLYVNEYVNKNNFSRLDQVAKILTNGKQKTLPNIEKDVLITKIISQPICHQCNNKITDDTYLLIFSGYKTAKLYNYHKKCYKLNSKDTYVLVIKNNENSNIKKST